ncbi:MAG: CPBP family intramembrane metalloprotease [Ruminococcaceae bacterium]|nr:CPBP family intramembrane metalloprotease [Oscillospiraceae bacterium]
MDFYNAEVNLAKKNEKSAIKRAANITGFAFFMLTSVMVFWSVPVTVIIKLVSKRPDITLKYLNDPTIVQVIQICVSSIAFIFPFIIYSKMMGERLSEVVLYNKPKEKKLMFPLILMGLGVCGFSNAVVSGAGAILQNFGFNYNVAQTENPTNIFGIILSFVATAVTPALVEEFAMRGAVMGTLRKYGESFAIITSALIFGLMHGNLVQIPFAFILGLFFGFAVIKSGTIWTAVIIHFLNNLFSISFDYILSNSKGAVVWFANIFYFIFLLALGFIGFLLYFNKGEDTFSLDNKTEVLTVKEKLISFLTAPCIIISFVIVLLESFFVYRA